MAEETGATSTTGESNEQGADAREFQAITSQEDFDKAIQARIARERAKIPTDYDDLKAKAEKFAEWENSQKTEAEKQKEALESAQRELAEARLTATRAQVAAAKGVPLELLSGTTQEELEASAVALIAFRGQQASLHVSTEGTTSTSSGTTADQFADFIGDKL